MEKNNFENFEKEGLKMEGKRLLTYSQLSCPMDCKYCFVEDLKIEKIQPDWIPKGNIFYKIEKEGQTQELQDIIDNHGKLLFEGAANAIDYLRKNAEH